MTTMDSDSESQDSDDGRRFRFEATRKDARAHLETGNSDKPSRRKTKHKSHSQSKTHRDRKQTSKYETRKDSRSSKDRDNIDKDLRHTIKSSRSVRHEDNKVTYKEQKDTSLVQDEKSSKSVSSFDGKDKARDSKYYRERDRTRSSHHRQESQERSHDRRYDERSLSDKYRNRCHDRFKHRSRQKSRDRSVNKLRSPESDKSRDECGKYDSCRKMSKVESKVEHAKEEDHIHKSNHRINSDNESRSIILTENVKTTASVDNHDFKDIDLSDYDVLSETDENLSDTSNSRSYASHCHKTKLLKHDTQEEYEKVTHLQITKHQQDLEELHKVNQRHDEPSNGSSNNNHSAISDFLLGSTSSTHTRTAEHINCKKDVIIPHQEEETLKYTNEHLDYVHTSLNNGNTPHSSDGRNSLGRENTECDSQQFLMETESPTYGPALPPQLVVHSDFQDNTQIASNIKNKNFIGPSLPETDISKAAITSCPSTNNDKLDQNSIMDQGIQSESENAFGPALPPHLIRQRNDSPENRIAGPAMLSNDVDHLSSMEDEDDCAIGPLPKDHPALRDSYVHEQLEERARRFKEQSSIKQETNISQQREEWMTELPSAQATNLGLAPRKFRLTAGPDMSDRSCWTDTPAKKAEKQKRQKEDTFNIKTPKMIDQDTEASEKLKKKEKSLLEMHQSNLRKKRKSEDQSDSLSEDKPVRRPFDRNIDLQTSQLDRSQKNAIFMKAQLLDDRFSRGEI